MKHRKFTLATWFHLFLELNMNESWIYSLRHNDLSPGLYLWMKHKLEKVINRASPFHAFSLSLHLSFLFLPWSELRDWSYYLLDHWLLIFVASLRQQPQQQPWHPQVLHYYPAFLLPFWHLLIFWPFTFLSSSDFLMNFHRQQLV